MFESLNLDKTYQFLLISLAFLLPITVFGANLVIVLICVIWIFSGNYKAKLNQIINNRLILASIIFFWLHVIGLLWSTDLRWGLHIIHKMWYFIGLFPILYTIVKIKYIKYYIYAFIMAIALTEICSYLIWFELIEPFKNATIVNPTPFMSHISYNPILAFAIYLVLIELVINKKMSNFMFSFLVFFAISMTINMFITGGRAGQIGFIVVITVLVFQIFDKQRIKSLMITLLLIPSMFLVAYQLSDIFKERVDLVFIEIINYSQTSNEHSVGLRINFNLNSFEIIKNHSLIGVGTGDFPTEYSKVNKINSPGLPRTTNPHNMYTLILVQLGLVGLLSLLSIFYYQLKISYNSPNKYFKNIGFTLPILFLVLMLADSYLLGHFTSLLFVFFSSFLYKDFERS
jgi:O-antigen ligase